MSKNTGHMGAVGAHMVDVEVDPETGHVKILRYTAGQDVGRAIHPAYVEGQIQRGVAQGIGWALNEEFIYDANGRLDNAGFLDYRCRLPRPAGDRRGDGRDPIRRIPMSSKGLAKSRWCSRWRRSPTRSPTPAANAYMNVDVAAQSARSAGRIISRERPSPPSDGPTDGAPAAGRPFLMARGYSPTLSWVPKGAAAFPFPPRRCPKIAASLVRKVIHVRASAHHPLHSMARLRRRCCREAAGNFPPEMILNVVKAAGYGMSTAMVISRLPLRLGTHVYRPLPPGVSAAVDAQLALGTTFLPITAVASHSPRISSRPVGGGAGTLRFFRHRSRYVRHAPGTRLPQARIDPEIEGGYHGMSDHALMSLAPKRLVNLPWPVPIGQSRPCRGRGSGRALQRHRRGGEIDAVCGQLAGVIVEPLQRLIPPKPGFLEALRAETEARDIPLIFDEVVTGFRFGYGGAQSLYGVTGISAPWVKSLAAVSLWAPSPDAPTWPFDAGQVGGDDFLLQIGTPAVIRWPPSPVERP